MALTKVTGHVVKPDTNIQFHNTKSTGIVTFAHTSNATSSTTGALQITGGVGIVKDLHVGGNVTVGGTLTYDDVTNIDSLGIITARGGIHIGPVTAGVATVYTNGNASFTGIVTATSFVGALPISNDGNNRVITATGSGGLNAEANFTYNGTQVDIAGTTDGILNLDTTDSRGAFIRFGQGGSSYNMVGCADGLVTGLDKQDMAVRAYDNFAIATNGDNERLRITSDGFVGINEDNPKSGLTIAKLGDYSTDDGNTYYIPVGKWSSAWNAVNAIDNSTDYWVGFVGGYTKSSSSVNIALAPNRGNVGNQAGMYISGEATGTSSADFTVGKIIGGSATGQGTSGNVRATKSELFRIDSNGNIGVNCTPATAGTIYTTVDHFIAIGDGDTGIAQDGDGQLELWANNQEIANFNTGQVTLEKVTLIKNSIGVGILPTSGGSGTQFGARTYKICIGDNDSGIAQNGDGNICLYSNNEEIIRVQSAGVSGTVKNNFLLNEFRRGDTSSQYGPLSTSWATDTTISDTISNYQRGQRIIIRATVPCGIALQQGSGTNYGGTIVRVKVTGNTSGGTTYSNDRPTWYRADGANTHETTMNLFICVYINESDTTFSNGETLTVTIEGKKNGGGVGSSTHYLGGWSTVKEITIERYIKEL